MMRAARLKSRVTIMDGELREVADYGGEEEDHQMTLTGEAAARRSEGSFTLRENFYSLIAMDARICTGVQDVG